jgi:hypothetical protein
MARYIGLGEDEPSEDSEKRLAKALKSLSDEWTILHHVSWQSKRGGRQGDGEADFIILHPIKGVLVIEVKGGGIDIEDGRWFTTDRHGNRHVIKNPYEQATASKHALIRWLRDQGLSSRIGVGHAVAFPHMTELPAVGPAGSAQISLIRPELQKIEDVLTECFAHWQLRVNMSEDDLNSIVSLLAPTVNFSPTLSGQSTDAEKAILTLTAEQVSIFSELRSNRGGLVLGSAGVGKTVLAIARAQQLSKDGFRTLLVCYNELLGAQLNAQLRHLENLTACTFHTLCLRQAAQAGLSIPAQKPDIWWEQTAPNLLIEACSKNASTYDAIVIDEAQDFSPLWLTALNCLISGTDDAPIFAFADPHQDIWKRDWKNGAIYPFTWVLMRNMRNTTPIAARIAASINIECRDQGISGPAPIWHLTKDSPRESDVINVVERLIDDGFGPSNLVVLSNSQELVMKLRERSIGPFSFGKWGSRGIAVETISRFKGLETQAAVVVLSRASTSKDNTEAYVGISRPRSVLIIVGEEPTQQIMNWL